MILSRANDEIICRNITGCTVSWQEAAARSNKTTKLLHQWFGLIATATILATKFDNWGHMSMMQHLKANVAYKQTKAGRGFHGVADKSSLHLHACDSSHPPASQCTFLQWWLCVMGMLHWPSTDHSQSHSAENCLVMWHKMRRS